MSQHPYNFIRAHRLRVGFSHDELAPLIGQSNASAISYYETGVRIPTLEGALSLQILFGVAPRDLFPGFFEAVEENVMLRAADLYASLDGKTDERSKSKRDWLDEMPGRGFDNQDAA